MDLAGGTGQVALALADRFAEVIAVDREEEMVACGRAKAEAAGVTHVRWVAAAAETVSLEGPVELDHDEVLTEAGFDYVGRFEFTAEQTQTVESLTGLVYSTPFLNREVLGDQVGAFETELSALLHSFAPDGVFEVVTRFAYQLATKPAVIRGG